MEGKQKALLECAPNFAIDKERLHAPAITTNLKKYGTLLAERG